MLVLPTFGEPEDEIFRSWIRQNTEVTEFWRIQLRIVILANPATYLLPCRSPNQQIQTGF